MTGVSDRMLFIGVSTSGSSIFRLFPRWVEILGLDASLEAYDIPLGASPEAFVAAVEDIAEDPRRLGALVTTHKMDVYEHAGRLFDELDADARLCRGVSCISKQGRKLVGQAKDPITAERALAEFLAPDHWAAGGHVLCLGAGGAGTALVAHFARLALPPEAIVVTDGDDDRLGALGSVVAELRRAATVQLEHIASRAESDALLEQLPPRSLVVNATGLGKDAPGSPISDNARFPNLGVVWELNYRGDLVFLEQARRQRDAQKLDIQDGWRYFLHGWTEHIAEIFHLDLTPAVFARLAESAESQRPVA
jgi:shikimate dehydrogenase